MNYSQQNIREKKNRITGSSHKIRYRLMGFWRYFRGLFLVAFLCFMGWQLCQLVEDVVDSTDKIQRGELLSMGDVSILYDTEGNEIRKVSNQDTDQAYVSLNQIPDCVKQAFVASEDVHFYEHHGMDAQEIMENIYQGIFQSQVKKDMDTTITRQLLQNRMETEWEDGGKTLSQVIKEQYLIISLEGELEKDEILELYLNTINLGENILGVQTASRYYFNKDISDVTMSEATVLAAIVADPVIYNPITNQSDNNIRRKTVLKSMLEMGYLSEEEYESTLGDDVYLTIQKEEQKKGNDPEYSDYEDAVLEQVMEDMKKQLGYTQTQAYNTIYRSGIKIYTCQDTDMQEICDEVIETCGNTGKEKQSQTSFVLLDHGTGEIKAIVGGNPLKDGGSNINYATEAKAQPGTLFDILSTYTPALDTVGLSLGSVEDDASYLLPDTLAPVTNGREGTYKGLVTLREALRQSLSVPAVKTLEKVTIQTSYEYLKRYGITTLVEQKPYSLSGETENSTESDLQYTLALGQLTEGVTNLEMTAAYGAIANQGVYKTPRFYNRVVDSQGNVLLENNSEGKRIMKNTTAWLLTNAMKDKENYLTGKGKEQSKNIFVSGRYAVSTGKMDDWYEGYSPYYTGGIWIGGQEESQETQGKQAKVIWKKIMEKVHRQRKISKGVYKKPTDIVEVEICTKCGNLAVKDLCNQAEGGSTRYKEYFAMGTQPEKNCTCHVHYLFCEDSKALASEKCPAEKTYTKVLLEKKETTETEDTPYTVAKNVTKELCSIHGEENKTK